MSSGSSQVSSGSVEDLVRSWRTKGVKLWCENGRLHYKAHKGALTEVEIERLRILKGDIVALLGRAADAEIAGGKYDPLLRRYCSPLALSQLEHWQTYQLGQRHAIRQIASATRLRGRLHIDALESSLSAVVHRHDALRTRIVVLDGVPIQEISESGGCKLRVERLTRESISSPETEISRKIESEILQPTDVALDPLFGVRLLRIHHDEHVLIVTMEHMISDDLSMRTLLRDLLTGYAQLSKGRQLCLPQVHVQFPEYALWQTRSQKSWMERSTAYWNDQLAGCRRMTFPVDEKLQTSTRSGWGAVSVTIGRDLKDRLREWCRLRQTTLPMSIFTAYVALALRWCNVSEAVIRYQSDGRTTPGTENTIGYFATVLYLRVGFTERDNFLDLMNRVTEAYCKAHENADFCSYTAVQLPRPEFTRNTLFNWVPRLGTLDVADLLGSEEKINCSAIPFAHPMLRILEWDREPGILLYDTDDGIVGRVYFPLNRFSIETMERFVCNFMVFIEALRGQPHERINSVSIV